MRESTQYKPLGYDIDPEGHPTFRYQIFGATVTDQIRVQDGGKVLTRTVSTDGLPSDRPLLYRLATGTVIEPAGEGTWFVDGRRYYLRLAGGQADVRVEKVGEKAVLTVPVAKTLEYSILW